MREAVQNLAVDLDMPAAENWRDVEGTYTNIR